MVLLGLMHEHYYNVLDEVMLIWNKVEILFQGALCCHYALQLYIWRTVCGFYKCIFDMWVGLDARRPYKCAYFFMF